MGKIKDIESYFDDEVEVVVREKTVKTRKSAEFDNRDINRKTKQQKQRSRAEQKRSWDEQ
jgi:hypothetical protein